MPPRPAAAVAATLPTRGLVAACLCGGLALGVGLCSLVRWSRGRKNRAAALAQAAPVTNSEVLFLGCGSSSGVPRAVCVMGDQQECETCRLAMVLPHHTNRNWRGNPCLLIRFVPPPTDSASGSDAEPPRVVNLTIDCGKTFLQAVLRWFPRYGVKSLDGMMLTHDHADAVLGLDDVRSLQEFRETNSIASTPIYVNSLTLAAMKAKFGYLVTGCGAACAEAGAGTSHPTHVAAGPDTPAAVTVERRVSQLSWPTMRPFVPFVLHGLDVLPLPVLHGEDYISLGFLFGTGLGMGPDPSREACLYISDVTRIPEATWEFLCTGQLPTPPADASEAESVAFFERFNHIRAHPLPADHSKWHLMPHLPVTPSPSGPRIALLVVDALFPLQSHNTHFNLPQALAFIERLRPRRALITGMSDQFEWHRHNAELLERRRTGELTVDVELAYDGLRFPISL